MSEASVQLSAAELAELERQVSHALESGDESALDILGYGEVSCVIGTTSNGRALACKRLPLFHSPSDWEVYRACFADYLAALEAQGVRPLPSTLEVVERPDGALAPWCLQPRLDAAGLLSRYFHSCDETRASELLERVFSSIARSVGPTLGLDGQLSNWILQGDDLYYLDVTTPMLRTEGGAERMPIAVFLASLPWALRAPVRRFMLADILNKYYDPRGVVLDLLGNLHKEKLVHLLPRFLEQANARVSPQLSAEEVKRYYDDDASSWALLQRLRRADRWWQKSVRRRVYPFLLPGKIER